MTHVTTQQIPSDTGPVPSTFLRRHPVAIFVALSYASAWAWWLPLVILGDRTPGAIGLMLAILGSAMPSTMAIVLVARLHGGAEVRRLLRRLLMGRVGIFWYAAIVALTALMVGAVWISTLFGAACAVSAG